jgi:hypothetical protein
MDVLGCARANQGEWTGWKEVMTTICVVDQTWMIDTVGLIIPTMNSREPQNACNPKDAVPITDFCANPASH